MLYTCILDVFFLLIRVIPRFICIQVIEKLASGEKVASKDFPAIQKEVEVAEGKRAAQRVISQAKENEERLDIALKLEKAKKQQLLQKRLLAKSEAKKRQQLQQQNK